MSKKTLVAILFLFTAVPAAVLFASPGPQAQHLALEVNYPSIPGIGKLNDLASGTIKLGQLVDFLFRAAIWLSGFIAFGTLLYVGFMFATSAGDPGKRKEAQQRLWAVFIGIALLLSMYIILFTINPTLVRLPEVDLTICGRVGECRNNAIPGFDSGNGGTPLPPDVTQTVTLCSTPTCAVGTRKEIYQSVTSANGGELAPGIANDRLAGLIIPNGASATIYEHANYTGRWTKIGNQNGSYTCEISVGGPACVGEAFIDQSGNILVNLSSLIFNGATKWWRNEISYDGTGGSVESINGEVSSVAVGGTTQSPPAGSFSVTLRENDTPGGKETTITESSPDLSRLSGFENDILSSIRIQGNGTARFYVDKNYEKSYLTITRGTTQTCSATYINYDGSEYTTSSCDSNALRIGDDGALYVTMSLIDCVNRTNGTDYSGTYCQNNPNWNDVVSSIKIGGGAGVTPNTAGGLRAAIINELGITMNGFDVPHLEWAYKKLTDVSETTNFKNYITGTTITAIPDGSGSERWAPKQLRLAQYPSNALFNVILVHELGHVIREDNLRDTILWNDHLEAYRNDGPITNYARTACTYPASQQTEGARQAEDFAEMVTYYLNSAELPRTATCANSGESGNPPYQNGGFPAHYNVMGRLLEPR